MPRPPAAAATPWLVVRTPLSLPPPIGRATAGSASQLRWPPGLPRGDVTGARWTCRQPATTATGQGTPRGVTAQ